MVPRSTNPGGPGRRDRPQRRRTTARARARALLGLAVLAPSVLALAGPADHAEASRVSQVSQTSQAAPLAEGDEPLALTLDELTPGEVPRVGSIEVSGRITNTDDRAWSTINLYPFIGDEPMTSPAELLEAQGLPTEVYVGPRVTDPGPYEVVDRLEPGESVEYSFTVARSRLPVDERGVYWFGVHALGQDEDGGRDTLADGRVRTFLPLIDTEPGGPGVGGDGLQPVSVVVPLRRRLLHTADGAVADPAGWATSLSDVGRLGSLSLMAEAGDDPTLTWLVDPALVDAVAQLAAGNPGRSLEATVDPEDQPVDGEGGATPSPDAPTDATTDDTSSEPGDESSSPTGGEGATASPEAPAAPTTPPPATEEQLDELDPDTRTAAVAAQRWLERMREVLGPQQQVLALPYGDLDVAAAGEHDPDLYDQARNRAGSRLEALDVDTDPGAGSPGGFVDLAGLAVLDDEDTVVVNDRMVGGRRGESPVPAVAEIDGRRVVVSSVGAASGGPGPGARRSTLAVRQRFLAEAAVRLVSAEDGRGEQPLVVTLPPSWSPEKPEQLLPGLQAADWVDLQTLADSTGGLDAPDVDTDALAYPDRQVREELPADQLEAAQQLVDTGRLLQDVLTLNDQVGSVVAAEAYSTVGYYARQAPAANVRAARTSTGFIRAQLGQVRITTPPGVTLSSESGRLPVSLENGLDVPVTVHLDARSDPPMSLEVPSSVDLPARGRVGVLVDATAQTEGVHNVTLMVTDRDGRPLGGQASLPIRSAQVSALIWLIIGSGAVLLLGAIATRVVRRVRTARAEHGQPDTQPEPRP